jgi:hypothetical protein
MTVHSYLNQIFYKHNKFDDGAKISDLEPWMLVSERLIYCAKPCVEIPVTNECINKPIEVTPFTPIKQDSLFWCAYTVHHGEADYWVIGNKYKNAELTEKQKMVDYINSDTTRFKRRFPKMSNVGIQEIAAELMVDKKTSWKTFFAMCAYYEFRAIVVYENTYLDFSPISDASISTYLFHRTKEGHISVLTEPLTEERIAEIKTTHLCLDQNPEKPLKAVSNYKVDELIDLAERLGVDIKQGIYNKWKKADWYNSVINKCKW